MSVAGNSKKNNDSSKANAAPVQPSPTTAPAADSQYRRQTALVALGRRAIAPPDISLLIQDAAALVAETLETDRYGAAELSVDGKSLMLRVGKTGSANAGDPLCERRVDFNPRESLAARAIETAQVVAAPEPGKRLPLADRFLKQQGIRAALLVPLLTADHSFGALGAFSTRPRTFQPEDMLFAETIAHLLSTTISRDRAHKALEDERRLTDTILATVDALVLTLDADGQILSVNPACQRATGFTAAELAKRHIWNTLIVHDDVAVMQTALVLARESDQPVERETLILAKSGERRRIRWSLAAKRNAAGSIDAIIGTGINVTDQRAAERRIAQLEAAREAVLPLGPDATQSQFRSLNPGPHGERRKRPRRAFNFLQRIAPMAGDKLPDRRQFHTVHCQDISSAGFSFLTSDPPTHNSYVVALGTPAVTIYLIAKIVHVTAVIRDDTTKYLVGCQYVGRANYGRKAAAAK
jgi:PAS domain S-box-containing protein